jgi:hypothetical protein
MKMPRDRDTLCQSDSQIFQRIQRLSIYRQITFGAEFLPKHQTLLFIPEIENFEKFIHRNSEKAWRMDMDSYNSTLRRGARMGLSPLRKAPLPLMNSLDQYILHMGCATLSEVLDALTTFAERVIPNIDRAPDALLWPVCGPLLITRDRWFRLSRAIMALLHLILERPSILDRPSFSQHRSWPDSDRLLRSAARAHSIFWRFAVPPRPRAAARGRTIPAAEPSGSADAPAPAAAAAAAAAAASDSDAVPIAAAAASGGSGRRPPPRIA